MKITNLPNENLKAWFNDRKDNTFIFFDTETTGLKRENNNQLTQIGAIATKFDLETFVFVETGRFNIKIKINDAIMKHMESEPDAPADKESEEYKKWIFATKKGILVYNHYDLVNSENYEDERLALEKFDNFLKTHNNVTLIAHNAPFDLSFIQFHELFIENAYEIIDSKYFFARIFFPTLKKMASHINNYQEILDRFHPKEGKKSASLKHIANGFNNEINKLKQKLENAHDAIVDCEITKEVFESGLKLLFTEVIV